MSTPLLIPLIPTPQTLTITLAGVQYQLSVWWNEVNQSWIIDIFDSSGDPIVTGIPMITGTDLLAPFKYLGFGGRLIAQTTNDPDAVPTFVDLGTTGNLYLLADS